MLLQEMAADWPRSQSALWRMRDVTLLSTSAPSRLSQARSHRLGCHTVSCTTAPVNLTIIPAAARIPAISSPFSQARSYLPCKPRQEQRL